MPATLADPYESYRPPAQLPVVGTANTPQGPYIGTAAGAATVPNASSPIPPIAPAAPPAAAPPAQTPAPPPPVNRPPSLTIAGSSPDYGNLIVTDPNVLAAQGDLSAQDIRDAATRDQNIRRMLINGGFDINDPSFDPSVLDPTTIQAIKDNRYSTAAQLALGRGRQLADLRDALAARGILSSGAFTGGSQRVQDSYELQTHNAIQSLLDSISGQTSAYATSSDARTAALRQAREAAAARIQADPRYQGTPELTAALDPTSGLYKTPDGRWYNPDGSPAAAPSGSGAGTTSTPGTTIGYTQTPDQLASLLEYPGYGPRRPGVQL